MSKIIFVLIVLAYSSIDVGDFIFKIHIEDKYIECTRSIKGVMMIILGSIRKIVVVAIKGLLMMMTINDDDDDDDNNNDNDDNDNSSSSNSNGYGNYHNDNHDNKNDDIDNI